MNELYAKDISKKIRSMVNQKGNSGKRITSIIPYGYIKGVDKDGKENWIVDKEAAEIVRLIFDLHTDKSFGPVMIAKRLNENDILTPSEYKGKLADSKKTWNNKSVIYILGNQVYSQSV